MRKHNFNNLISKVNTDYDLTEFEYHDINSKSIVKCKKHGAFLSSMKRLLKGQRCPQCANENKILNKQQFIEKANHIHQNKYNYEKTEYHNSTCKIKIECPTHGEFTQFASNHLKGYGCIDCKINQEFEKFKNKAKQLHLDKFNYSKSIYKNNKEPITIICPKHSEFLQRPDNHLQGNGCPKCSTSKGELKIQEILKKYNIDFVPQKTFEDCKNKYKLRFDIYLPKLNTCIEYDGPQHQKEIKFFGGNKNLLKYKINDNIKNLYCINNNIKLLRINYLQEDNIENYLLEKIINTDVPSE